jgi:hypothetical protein
VNALEILIFDSKVPKRPLKGQTRTVLEANWRKSWTKIGANPRRKLAQILNNFHCAVGRSVGRPALLASTNPGSTGSKLAKSWTQIGANPGRKLAQFFNNIQL